LSHISLLDAYIKFTRFECADDNFIAWCAMDGAVRRILNQSQFTPFSANLPGTKLAPLKESDGDLRAGFEIAKGVVLYH
jgi:hypothetical protein